MLFDILVLYCPAIQLTCLAITLYDLYQHRTPDKGSSVLILKRRLQVLQAN